VPVVSDPEPIRVYFKNPDFPVVIFPVLGIKNPVVESEPLSEDVSNIGNIFFDIEFIFVPDGLLAVSFKPMVSVILQFYEYTSPFHDNSSQSAVTHISKSQRWGFLFFIIISLFVEFLKSVNDLTVEVIESPILVINISYICVFIAASSANLDYDTHNIKVS
jgi:hypothetical protein